MEKECRVSVPEFIDSRHLYIYSQNLPGSGVATLRLDKDAALFGRDMGDVELFCRLMCVRARVFVHRVV
jgi:hypothetical protein